MTTILDDLKQARGRLSSTPYLRYICHALRTERARKLIRKRMGKPPPEIPADYFTLERWLAERGYGCAIIPGFLQINGFSYPFEVMRDYRVRWLTSLINELEQS